MKFEAQNARLCAGCKAPLIQGQRVYFGQRSESDKRFAKRLYCSIRCEMKANKARRLAELEKRKGK